MNAIEVGFMQMEVTIEVKYLVQVWIDIDVDREYLGVQVWVQGWSTWCR
jgi:hypothetical protein